MMMLICPYCNKKAKLVKGSILFPFFSRVKNKWFYVCPGCDARVGCHRYTKLPLGTLANEELRQLRKEVHEKFDPLWMNGKMKRKRAYTVLSKKLKIKKEDCHIAKFDIKLCTEALKILKNEKRFICG